MFRVLGSTATHYVAVHSGGNLIVTKATQSLSEAEGITQIAGPDGTVYKKGVYHSHHIIFPNDKYYTLDEFKIMEDKAWNFGFSMVSCSPLTRSSYHADEDFIKLKASCA